jgi:5-methylthioadenosine/S-adenosylhomocysteine deaminase
MTLRSQLDVRDRIVATEGDPGRRILLAGAHIVTMEREGVVVGDLLVQGSRIEAIRPGLAHEVPDAIVVDASRAIVIPGLVDSHVHAWEGQLRGLAPDARQRNYIAVTHAGAGPHYRPEDLAIAERLTAAQAINAGTTTIVDNCHNSRTAEHSNAALEALIDSGIRAVHAAGAAQVGEHDHQLPQDLLRLREEYPVSGDGLVSLRMYDDIPSLESWRFADEHGFDLCLELGPWTRNAEMLARSGLMRPGHTYNHCAALSPDVWRAVADSGAAINLCPRSDSQFGIGSFAPALEPSRYGLQEGISSDNEVSYGHDLFTEMRTLLTIQRGLSAAAQSAGSSEPPAPYGAADVLRAATVGGALNAGLSASIGSLAPGKRADLVLLTLDDVTTRLWGSVIGTVVNAGGIGTVDAVFVDGKVRKWGGQLVGADYAALASAGERSRERLLEALGISLDEARRGVHRDVDEAKADDTMKSYIQRPGPGRTTVLGSRWSGWPR